jgi:hypothetical protein
MVHNVRVKLLTGPEVAAEKVPDKPIQSLSSCSTTRSTRKVNENDPSSEKKTDATCRFLKLPKL